MGIFFAKNVITRATGPKQTWIQHAKSTHPPLFKQLIVEAKWIKEHALLLDRQINHNVHLSDEEKKRRNTKKNR